MDFDHNSWRTDLLPCSESHDGFHHFPLNIQTQIERNDCIECGMTKEQIMFRLLNKPETLKKKRSGPPPPPGNFPKPGEPKFPKP